MEPYMSESNILKEIQYYVDTDFYNYAVMIDGAWGSGKTHFVKNVLIQELESKGNRVLYVSLYGVSNIQELGKKLYLDFLLQDKSKYVTEHAELAESIIGTVFDIGSPFMGKLGDINIKGKKIRNIVENTVKHICPMKDCVLIFDDLERCNCSIQESLGYINGFVEQAGMKVIIIANQKELRKKMDAQTLAMQIQAVLGKNEMLDFTKPESKMLKECFKYMSSGQSQMSDKEDVKEISLKEAKERADQLFGEESEYERIREKIVGIVFRYNPDVKKVMSSLIEKNFTYNSEARKPLEKNINFLAECMEKEKHINFRSFQFFLQKIDVLFQMIKDENYENADFVYKRLILSSWYSCILFKAGKLNEDWKEGEYTEGEYFRVRFIEDYIKYSRLDHEKGIKIFEKFDLEESRKHTLLNDPINWLQDKWYKADNDEVILKNMNTVIENARNGKYDIGSYDRIIQIFLEIYIAGFDLQYVDRLVAAMCEGIKEKRANGILDYISTRSYEKKSITILYNRYIGDIQNAYRKSKEKKSGDDLNAFLEEENWAEKMYEYCYAAKYPKKQEDYEKKLTPFLGTLDMNKLIEKLENTNGENLQKFASVLRLVYPPERNSNAYLEENEEREKLYIAMKTCKESETQLIRKFQYQTIEEYLCGFISFENKE